MGVINDGRKIADGLVSVDTKEQSNGGDRHGGLIRIQGH
jgi:hypothetical protein